MKASRVVTAFVFVSALPVLAWAQSEATAMAERLMVQSGLTVQLRGLADSMGKDIRRESGNLDATQAAALAGAAKEAFRAELLQADMSALVARKLSVADMNAALTWLAGPIARQVTRAEEASATLDEQAFGAFLAKLKTQPLSAARMKIIAGLIGVTDAVKSTAAAQEAIGLGVAVGMNSMEPRERRVNEAELRRRIQQVLPPERIHAALSEQLPVLYAFTYRDVPDADLAQYVEFLRGGAGRRYQDAMTAAFIEGLGRASVRVGELASQRRKTI